MGNINEKDVLEVSLKTLFGPVQDLFNKLTGPAAEEYGLMWADSVKMRRTNRLIKGLGKVKLMLAEAGFDPHVVLDKFLLPIFDGMSVEDDENLQDMWAALLANAASPENAGKVRPSFIAILKEMSPDEALLLTTVGQWTPEFEKHLHQNAPTRAALDHYISQAKALHMGRVRHGFLKLPGETSEAHENRLRICIGLLSNHGLVEVGADILTVSELGQAFLEACRPPKPKEKE